MRNKTKERIQRKARMPITEPIIFATGDEDEDAAAESVLPGAEEVEVVTGVFCVDNEADNVVGCSRNMVSTYIFKTRIWKFTSLSAGVR
jgi:hypothetical protein